MAGVNPMSRNLPNPCSISSGLKPSRVCSVEPRRLFSRGIQANAGRVRYALAVSMSELESVRIVQGQCTAGVLQ